MPGTHLKTTFTSCRAGVGEGVSGSEGWWGRHWLKVTEQGGGRAEQDLNWPWLASQLGVPLPCKAAHPETPQEGIGPALGPQSPTGEVAATLGARKQAGPRGGPGGGTCLNWGVGGWGQGSNQGLMRGLVGEGLL